MIGPGPLFRVSVRPVQFVPQGIDHMAAHPVAVSAALQAADGSSVNTLPRSIGVWISSGRL